MQEPGDEDRLLMSVHDIVAILDHHADEAHGAEQRHEAEGRLGRQQDRGDAGEQCGQCLVVRRAGQLQHESTCREQGGPTGDAMPAMHGGLQFSFFEALRNYHQ